MREGELFLDDGVVAVGGQASLRGLGFFDFTEGADLDVKERVAGAAGQIDRVVLPLQGGDQGLRVFFMTDGGYLYQIYANAAKLIGYATQPDGSLAEVTAATIPYQSPQGLAGF